MKSKIIGFVMMVMTMLFLPVQPTNAMITVSAVSYNAPARLTITDLSDGHKKTVFLAPAVLSVVGPDIWTYCIGLTLPINRGKLAPAVVYDLAVFDNDSDGNSVSATTAREIGYLWQLGKTVSHADAIAIQWGIWVKEYGTSRYSYSLVGGDPYNTSQAALYAASTGMVSAVPYKWVSRDGEHQPWLAVPEPASWGMMIAGFGMMGVAMRIRARRATYSYAS